MKSTMMSSPLLVPGMLERAGKLFPRVEIVSYLPMVLDIAIRFPISTDARGIWQLRSVARESAEVTGLALYCGMGMNIWKPTSESPRRAPSFTL